MTHDDPFAAYSEQIAGAYWQIRQQICGNALAAKWHIGKGSRLRDDHSLIEQQVIRMDDDARSDYIDQLDELIANTTKVNQACAILWAENADSLEYATALDQLRPLLHQFLIRPQVYEKLVRQSPKPLLEKAKRLSSRPDHDPAVKEIETMLRMRLPDYIRGEEIIETTLQELDGYRSEISAHYVDFAVQCARDLRGQDPDSFSIECATHGLRRAVVNYDFNSEFSFESYAKHWIETYVKDGRAS